MNTHLRAVSGIVDFGPRTITGPHFVPGLFEGRVSNSAQPDQSINKVDANPNTSIQLGLRRINQNAVSTDGGEISGWASQSTYIYTGQIYIADNDVPGDGLGKISFGENFDDYALVTVDGVTRLENSAWNVPTTSGSLTLPAGWHDIEFRAGQGGGGVGAVRHPATCRS